MPIASDVEYSYNVKVKNNYFNSYLSLIELKDMT